MTAYPVPQPFYRQSPLTVDTNHAQKYYEEEDGSILDENILDHSGLDSGLEMSPNMADSRRDSFVIFSPKSDEWHQSAEMQSLPSNNPYLEQHSNNHFMRMDPHQQPQHSYPHQQGPWSTMTSSGSATPLQHYDGLPTEFDPNSSIFHRPQAMQGQTPFSNPTNQVAMFTTVGQSQSIPTSPQRDWMDQERANQAMAKRPTRPNSPSLMRSHNELRRGDGIRKKNARFDIPAERNLNNIDQLIAQSHDEAEIKELKQQKRLLRNRQAALDSRQRKKQHTERLEDEKKQYTAIMNDLQDKVDQGESEIHNLIRRLEHLELEKQELIRSHTIETGELRKKINAMTSHIQSIEGSAMSTIPAHVQHQPGFPGSFGEMDGLTVGAPWGNVPFMSDFPVEHPAEQPKQKMQVVVPVKAEGPMPSEGDKPSPQGGFLFLLLLYGALAVTRGSTVSIPQVSEDVRAASATLLDNVLKDAGVAQSSSTMEAMGGPQPSGSSWATAPPPAPSAPIAANGMDGVTHSMLGQLADALTQPTQQQTNEQAFSLSAAQYNGVTSQDFPMNAPSGRSTASRGRRNLAEALAAMRSTNKQSAAEVYTRSLLWDQIPDEVVRDFAKMVAECNTVSDEDGHCEDDDTT